MSRSIRTFILSFLGVVLLSACGGHTPGKGKGEGDTLSLNYASRVKVVRFDGFTQVSLADPWNSGKTLHRYILVPVDKPLPDNLPAGTVVRTPLKKAVVSTSVHCGLIIDLGRGDAIAGICEPQYIHIPWVLERVKKGEIADCGSGLSPTVEKIIDLSPDAIFLSPFQNSGGYGQIEHLGIPIIETADYMETSALGRAEWMKFYGLLFGAEQAADSLFAGVERSYLELKAKAEADAERPTVLMDKQVGSVWYVPGGQSTIGKLIADAATNYPWSGNDDSGSLSLPFESVLDKAQQADVWLFRYNSPNDISFPELLSENQGYAQFKAFNSKNVFGCNTATVNFYEETPFHPERLLRDIVSITHPKLNLAPPSYFQKLK